MPSSRRSILAAAGGLVSLEVAASMGIPAPALAAPAMVDDVVELVQRSATAHAALMRGDLESYRALITYTDDFTIMTPFGGPPTHGRDMTEERMRAMARFFRSGTFEQELVQAYGSAEIVVLAVIERQNVEVGGLPAQDWPLRVTLVYRRDGNEWRLAHRHADPLVEPISLKQAAALARGKPE
ncbi:MAG: nuclear transport factor 2 family protein [Hyphomicrobium sp.]